MTDEERLSAFLRHVLPPPMATDAPSRDLWLEIVERKPPPRWSWIDLSLAGAVFVLFVWQPRWFVWLAYHL